MAEIRVLSSSWTVSSGASRSGGSPPPSIPAEFVAAGVEVADTVVFQSAPLTRGGAAAEHLEFSYDAGPGDALIAAVRHESGALTFHAPAATRAASGPAQFSIPVRWATGATAQRGFVTQKLVTTLLKFGKPLLEPLARVALAKLVAAGETALWKRKHLREGWHRVTAEGLRQGRLTLDTPTSGDRSLLLLHGTFSNAASAFGPLGDPAFFDAIAARYGGRVYAFNHLTISRSLDDNVQDLLKGLNQPTTFDVITHSRGGLVLRTLIERAGAFGPAAKRFRLGHAVLVASPNAGTPLARTGRWNETLGALANLIEVLPDHPWTSAAWLVAEGLKWLAGVLTVDLPGLHAMNPDGSVVQSLQRPPGPPEGRYSALVANYQPDGRVLRRLLDAGLDAFFETASDLVVPAAGGWQVDDAGDGHVPAGRVGCFGPGGNLAGSDVTHVGFFGRPATREFLLRALEGKPQALPPIDLARPLPATRLLRDGHVALGTTRPTPTATEPDLNVTVVNGDLLFVTTPLMVGHYEAERLSGAEWWVDQRLDGAMTQALEAGLYPTRPGTVEVFTARARRQREALVRRFDSVIVVGLGVEGTLQDDALVETIRCGVLAWAKRLADDGPARRDDPEGPTLALTLIGSGGAGISPAQSAEAIIRGVRAAMDSLDHANGNGQRRGGDRHRRWPRLRSVRIVERYLDRATEAWKALDADRMKSLGYRLTDRLEQTEGWLPRVPGGYRGADYDFVRIDTRDGPSGAQYVTYTIDTGRARMETTAQAAQVSTIRHLLSSASAVPDGSAARTLFQLLVPTDVEPMLKGTRDLQLELTPQTAGIPWEVLDDGRDAASKPWAIRTQLLRRLRTDEFRRPVVDADRDDSALIIGEPACPPEYPPLPGARAEVELIEPLLRQSVSDTVRLSALAPGDPGPAAQDVLNALFSRQWRVVHVAGHGRPDDPGKRLPAGIVLSNDVVLSASEIRAMRVVPELVFVNCCYLGQVGTRAVLAAPAPGVMLRDHPAFAAGLAKELIESGVRCVVAAGWAVDDQEALMFAQTFYEALAAGGRFIDAVGEAREKAYDVSAGGVTWAAYQCYGDPDWRLVKSRSRARARTDKHQEERRVASEQEMVLRLTSVAVLGKFSPRGALAGYRDQLKVLHERAVQSRWHLKVAVAEALAAAYAVVQDYDAAITCVAPVVEGQPRGMTTRAIEDYANWRAHRAWRRVRALGASISPAEARRAARASRDDLAEAQVRLDQLLQLGRTAERLSLMGSLHKRRAMIAARSQDPATRRGALRQALECYTAAISASGDGDASYPMVNVLAINAWLGRRPAPAEFAKCRALIAARHATEPTFWTLVTGCDLALIEAASAARLAAQQERLLDAYRDCLRARPAGIEWDSVQDMVEFVLERSRTASTAAPRAKAERAAAIQIIEWFEQALESDGSTTRKTTGRT